MRAGLVGKTKQEIYPVEDRQVGDCWIWPEGSGVRYWTPDATGLMSIEGPGDASLGGRIPELRDRHVELDLAQSLESPLATLLGLLLDNSPAGLRLHLAGDLNPAWQDFPYQWLCHRGRNLHGRLLAITDVPHSCNLPLRPARKEVIVLDLWVHETALHRTRQSPFRFLPVDDQIRVYRGIDSVQAFLRIKDLSAYAAVCVISHGTEVNGSQPLRLPDGSAWGLPADERMPPLVILLVCGNDDGNLVATARTLLERGAQAVLAPIGRLDAAAADKFLRRFLDGWRRGERLDDLLMRAQRAPHSEHGAQRLRLVGRGDLTFAAVDPSRARRDTELALDALSGDGGALVQLVNRITFRCYRENKGLASGITRLFDALGMEYANPVAETRLLRMLDAVEHRLWPLSNAWVLPLLAYLAEGHDHALLEKYEDAHRALDPSLPATPYSQYGWFKVYYRQGQDAAAVAELVKGFGLLAPTAPCNAGGVALLGQLTNVLLDLDLPDQAQVAYDRLDRCFCGKGDDLLDEYRARRLDRAARLALRQGRPDAALANFRLRQAEALREGEDGERELAWLLFVSAWVDESDARPYAVAVKNRLRDIVDTVGRLGAGNHSAAYLLRALALWAWRSGDGESAQMLVPYTGIAQRRLYVQDPVPFAHMFGYLHLYRANHPDHRLDLPEWGEIEGVLEAQHQWLDAAVFNGLLGRPEQVQRNLHRFRDHRSQMLKELFGLPDWLGMGVATGWQASAEQRWAIEARLMVRRSPPLPVNPQLQAAQTFLLPSAGEGGPQGRKREETARFRGTIRDQGRSGGLAQELISAGLISL